MKPDTPGHGQHPLEIALIDGLEPAGQPDPLGRAPMVRGTRGISDSKVLDWARAHMRLPMPATTALLMPSVTQSAITVLRIPWCPDCREWAPCTARRERGY